MALKRIGRVEVIVVVKKLIRIGALAFLVSFLNGVVRFADLLLVPFCNLSVILPGLACPSGMIQLSPFWFGSSTVCKAAHEGKIGPGTFYLLVIFTFRISDFLFRCSHLVIRLVL